MLRVLHLEDQEDDAYLIERVIRMEKIEAILTRAKNREEYLAALEKGEFDLILADGALPGFDGMEALEIALRKAPEVAFIAISGVVTQERASAMLNAGASNFISKDR